MPTGQEVDAEWTNSAGLALCGGDPAAKQKWPYGAESVHAQLYIDSIGGGSSVKGLVGINHSGVPHLFQILFLDFERLFYRHHTTWGWGGTSGAAQ